MKLYRAANYDPNRRNNWLEKFSDHQTAEMPVFPDFWPKHAYRLKFTAGNFYFLNRSSKSHSDNIFILEIGIIHTTPVGSTKNVKNYNFTLFTKNLQKLI